MTRSIEEIKKSMSKEELEMLKKDIQKESMKQRIIVWWGIVALIAIMIVTSILTIIAFKVIRYATDPSTQDGYPIVFGIFGVVAMILLIVTIITFGYLTKEIYIHEHEKDY